MRLVSLLCGVVETVCWQGGGRGDNLLLLLIASCVCRGKVGRLVLTLTSRSQLCECAQYLATDT